MTTRGSLAREEEANAQPSWPPEDGADATTAELEDGNASEPKTSCQARPAAARFVAHTSRVPSC